MWSRRAEIAAKLRLWPRSSHVPVQGSTVLRSAEKIFDKVFSVITQALALQATVRQPTTMRPTLDDWKHFTIYQIVTDRFALSPNWNASNARCPSGSQTYCGGTFQGIISKLDYIQGMGFNAVWISPVVANTGGNDSYHGYWAQDLYSINPHFGSADDLRALSAALHSRDMYLMVDVVANHMGPQSQHVPNTPEYARTYAPFDRPEHYHAFCTIRNYDDQNEVEQCWLGSEPRNGLADLNTETPQVIDLLNEWIGGLVRNYSIDALRIDTVKHVRQSFWPAFVQSAGKVYCTGEVLSGDAGYVAQYQRNAGLQGLLNYPLFYPLTRTFQARAQGFDELVNMVTNTLRSSFPDPMALTNFLENHDNPRFPSLFADRGGVDTALVQNAITFILTADGIPTIYYGQEQMLDGGQDPYNREAMWTFDYNTSSETYVHIAKINRLRSFMASSRDESGRSPITTPLTSLYKDQTAWVYSKGPLLVALSSDGSSGSNIQTLEIASTQFPPNTRLVDILSCNTSSVVKVRDKGSLRLSLKDGKPAVLYPVDLLATSGICEQ